MYLTVSLFYPVLYYNIYSLRANHNTLYLAAACHWDPDEGEENEWWWWRPWERLGLSFWIASNFLWSFTVILQILISILRLGTLKKGSGCIGICIKDTVNQNGIKKYNKKDKLAGELSHMCMHKKEDKCTSHLLVDTHWQIWAHTGTDVDSYNELSADKSQSSISDVIIIRWCNYETADRRLLAQTYARSVARHTVTLSQMFHMLWGNEDSRRCCQ